MSPVVTGVCVCVCVCVCARVGWVCKCAEDVCVIFGVYVCLFFFKNALIFCCLLTTLFHELQEL